MLLIRLRKTIFPALRRQSKLPEKMLRVAFTFSDAIQRKLLISQTTPTKYELNP